MAVMSAPSKVMAPELAGVTPQTVLTRVVLPAPLGPIRPSTSPRASDSVTPRSACRPLKCRDAPSRRRISDMLRPPKPQRDQPVRQEQKQHDNEKPEHTGVKLHVVAPDRLFETEIDKGAADDTKRRGKPAKQRHHDGLHRIEDVEDVGGIDIVDPRGIDAAGSGHET